MKKLLILVMALAIPAVSNAKDSLDGCGLGWEVTDKETYLGTTTRMTTNMTVPPTFGMTTGTLGCKQLTFAANEREAVNFVAQNYPTLKQQLATGQGEYVEALVEVMGCGNNIESVRANYNTVVAPAQNGVELYTNLKSAMCI